jgi:hypothetical protein
MEYASPYTARRLVTPVYSCHKPLLLIAYVWKMPYWPLGSPA